MYLTEQMVGMNPPPQLLQQQQPPILRQLSQHVLPGKVCGPEPQRREGKARGEVSRSSLEDAERAAQCNRQGASDGQILQPAFLECGLSGSGPPIGLRLRKSASLVDFFNKSLADQGRQSQEQSLSSNACDGSTPKLAGAVLDVHHQTDTSTDRSTLHQGALPGASLTSSISSSSAGATWSYVPSTDAQGATVSEVAQPKQQAHPYTHYQLLQLVASQPLPASQSQIDLESFAASILLDDMQPVSGEDLSSSWRRGDEGPRSSECSINDQVMHSALADSCADTAWMAEEDFEPALRELAASSPSAAAALLNPFAGLAELECAAAAAAAAPAGLYCSARRSLTRTASVPPGRQLVDPFFISASMVSCAPGPHLSRTVSMPAAAAAASPRKRRNVQDLLKAGSGGVTKTSPRSMMRAASAMDIPYPELLAQPFVRTVL